MQIAPEKIHARKSTEALRILVVTSVFPNAVHPEWGIFNGHAVRHLAEVARVRVVSPVKWFPGLGWASRRERALAAIPKFTEYHGIKVTHPRYFRTPGFGHSWHAWLYRRSLEQHVKQAITEHRPHVILAVWAYPDGVAVQQIAAELGIPVVIKCIGSDIHQFLNDSARQPLIMDALRGASRVVAVSERLARLMVQHGAPPEKMDVVYNGVDRQVFRPMSRGEARAALKLPAHGKILLCVANLVPIKRHHDLLQAFQILRRHLGIEARLVLAGDGPLMRPLLRQAEALRIANEVRFAGACAQSQIPLWINACDAVCLASGNEGLPNVLVEALACGRPVVATQVGGIPELVRTPEHGRLVQVGDPVAMAQAMAEGLGRSWNSRQISACPQVISWEQSTTQLFASLTRAHSMQ